MRVAWGENSPFAGTMTGRLLGQTAGCGSEIAGCAGFLGQHRDAASAGGGLDLLHPERHGRARRIGKKPDPDHTRNRIKRQFEQFGGHALDL
jgi:hypothetical protein